MIITSLLFLCTLALLSLFFLYANKPNVALEYLLLGSIVCLSVLNTINFNTDAEDTYIGLRYVKNLVDGNGLVFNTFDKVEGYSDFLWLLLIAAVHKITYIDIPQSARLLGLVFSILTVLYTSLLATRFTQSKSLGYMAAFLVSLNGSFACYGLSGLENPLFALFILLSIDLLLNNRWYLLGIVISLAAMTRPEGVMLAVPVVIYLLFFVKKWTLRMTLLCKTACAAFVLFIPWTLWRYNYYGYLIPNTIAAKHGMDFWYQLKIGFKYTFRFMFDNIELVVLIGFPTAFLLFNNYRNKSIKVVNETKIVILFISLITFVIIYTYFGGDWMPGFRFYASIIPLISIFMVVLWSHSQFLNRNMIFICILAVTAFTQIRTTLQSPYMIKGVNEWRSEVDGLKKIGLWFKSTLPDKTLIATFPNGAFSYYNELPTIDAGGLTDNTVGRFGSKQKIGGVPGHIAEHWKYGLGRKPEIIAVMGGRGFETEVNKSLMQGYENVTFTFKDYRNPNGRYVNLYIRNESKESILKYLLSNADVQIEWQGTEK